MYKRFYYIIILAACLCVLLVGWLGGYWEKPVKYAVREEDFGEYTGYILVKEVHYTGTGWIMVGDENGYFDETEIRDIELLGAELPLAESPAPENYNVFLCIVEKTGTIEHMAFLEEIECYMVEEWYPVYPIVRNRLGGNIWGSKKYMTQTDMVEY